jgi:hypothetical protein
MSLIQPILDQRRQERQEAVGSASLAPENGAPAPQEGLRSTSLGCHADWYRENLGHCSEPMLQYEWAWLQGRIDALRQLQAGEDGRYRDLRSECQIFRTLLLQEFASRGLRPMPPRACVISSEEAWEITSRKVREDWGIL